MEDKTAIYKAAKNLKSITELGANLSKAHRTYSSLIIYLVLFEEQRKKLIPYFNIKLELTIEKQKQQIEKEEYCLFIDNKKVNLS